MIIEIRLSGNIKSNTGIIKGNISTSFQKVSGNITFGGTIVSYYEGPYEFIPTQEDQLIEIDGLTARENIVVKPIPHNYGLITWDGSVLTVS